MYNVILWGMGDSYDDFVACKGHSMVKVVAITDSVVSRYGYGRIDGIPIIRPEDIGNQEYDYLIITAIKNATYKEIVEKALALGIEREKIIPSRVFQIPFFNFDEYIQIKNAHISFLSDRCFATFLYYRFGFQRNSPTINMYAASNADYLRFLSDVEGHLRLGLEQVTDAVDKPYEELFAYPRGCVGDSEWVFSHDATFESAAERWRKGVERFNYTNFVAFMSITSDEAAYAFDSLPIPHKLGFYWKDLNLKSVVYIPEWSDPQIRVNNKVGYIFGNYVNHIASAGEMKVHNINWMKFLQFKDGFIRMESGAK